MLTKNYLNVFIFICVGFFSLCVNANLKSQNTITFERWYSKNGLPQNTISKIVQTQDGYLWLATSGGLVRFDGVNFKTYDVSNLPLISSNRIMYLHETKSGDLILIAYESPMIVYRKGEFYDYSKGRDAMQYYFESETQFYESGERYWVGETKIVQDNQHIIYLFTVGRGIVAIDPITYQKIQGYKFLESHKFSLLESDEYGIIFSDENNLYVQNNGFKKIGVRDSSYFIGDWFDKIANCTWSFKQGQLFQYKKGKITQQLKAPEIVSGKENKIIWSRTDKYLNLSLKKGNNSVRYDVEKKEFSIVDYDYKTETSILIQIFEDKEGNIWHGTGIGGLFKEKSNRFTYIDKDERIKSHNYYPIVKSDSGHIFVGYFEANYYEFNASGDYIPNQNYITEKLKASNISDLELFENRLYTATKGALYEISNNKINTINFPPGRYVEPVLYRTRNNDFLIGSYNKVYYYKNKKFIEHPINILGKLEKINHLFEDYLNRLWVVSEIGIFKYDYQKNSIAQYEIKGLKRADFRGIYEDEDHRIYVGSYGNGLTIIDNEKVYNISTKNGLYDNVVSTITEDQRGNIWLTGNKGLTRVAKQDIVEFIKDQKKQLNVVLYNEETDELRTSEFNGGGQHNKCWLGDEVYLFPTINGCVKVNLADFKPNLIPPPVHIEKIVIGDSVFTYKNYIEIPYSENRLEINYTGLSYVSPFKNNFKYKLEGYDKSWVNAGNNRLVYYTKLPPGNYTFRVIASNNEGIWNEKGASVQIIINPLYYQNFAFQVIIILISVVLIVLITFSIVRRAKKREQEKSALMDILPDLVIKLDRSAKYLDIYGNPSALVEPFDKLKGKNISEFVGDEISLIVLANIEKAINTKTIQLFDYQLKLADGKVHEFEGRIIAKDTEEVLLIARDITDANEAQLKILENEKKLLLSLEKEKKLLKRITEQQKLQLEAIINTEEKERRRIAVDLHDGIGQLLSSVKINLAVAKDKIYSSDLDLSKNLIETSKSTIDQITAEIRNISYNLLPPSLEQFGLASAIEEELKKLNENPSLKISFYSSLNDEKIESKIEVILFRSFQEIINNAFKHSRASEITIQLIAHGEKILLMIEDNGVGFDFNKGIQKKDSSGLKNLFSRMALINGKMKIDSNSIAGTSITIEVPIK